MKDILEIVLIIAFFNLTFPLKVNRQLWFEPHLYIENANLHCLHSVNQDDVIISDEKDITAKTMVIIIQHLPVAGYTSTDLDT